MKVFRPILPLKLVAMATSLDLGSNTYHTVKIGPEDREIIDPHGIIKK